jgi:hypothetical protein
LRPGRRVISFFELDAPDPERAERMGEFWSYPQRRTFAELLTDCEEDRRLRAVLIGMLRGFERDFG